MSRRTSPWVLVAATAGLLVAGTALPAGAAPPPPVIENVSPDHGPVTPGQVVTVTGGVFVDGDTYVLFGEEWLTPSVESPSVLTFVVPARSAGAVQLRIAVGDEESAAALYTVIAPPVVIPSPTPSAEVEVARPDPTPAPRPSSTPRADRPLVAREIPKAAPPPELAATGTGASSTAQYALTALLTGGALMLVTRRRRQPTAAEPVVPVRR